MAQSMPIFYLVFLLFGFQVNKLEIIFRSLWPSQEPVLVGETNHLQHGAVITCLAICGSRGWTYKIASSSSNSICFGLFLPFLVSLFINGMIFPYLEHTHKFGQQCFVECRWAENGLWYTVYRVQKTWQQYTIAMAPISPHVALLCPIHESGVFCSRFKVHVYHRISASSVITSWRLGRRFTIFVVKLMP